MGVEDTYTSSHPLKQSNNSLDCYLSTKPLANESGIIIASEYIFLCGAGGREITAREMWCFHLENDNVAGFDFR